LVLNSKTIISGSAIVGDLVANPPSGSDVPVVIGAFTYGWGRWSGSNNSVTAATGTANDLPGLFSYTNASPAFAAPPGTAANVNVAYAFVGGPKPLDSAGNAGNINSLSGLVNFTTGLISINTVLKFGNTATFTAAGAGTLTSGAALIGAPLTWTCSGAACNPSGAGTFNARFFGASFSQVMTVNGTLLSATNPANSPVIFLGVTKCPTC
jgi:hypothetical protein